jgi:uncharacterized membrane protein
VDLNVSVEPVRAAKINSTILKTVIFLLLVLSLVSSASARDYTLEEATTNIILDPNGVVHVEESISYIFDGNYNDIYRELKVLPGESIQNIEGHCSDKACKFRVETISDGYKLIGELPDPTPRSLTFFISYDHYGAVKIHNDISEFHYKLWGEEWEKPLGGLKGNITLPVENESEINYWIHPAEYTQEVNVEKNIINLRTGEIPSYKWYEIRAVFPRIESPNSTFVQVDDAEGLEKILAVESEYKEKSSTLKKLYDLTLVVVFSTLAFSFFIYFKYGREPEISYVTKYERKPPTESKPAVVNAIMKGRRGTPTIDGFTATIMDLASLGYISLSTVKLKEKEKEPLLKPESKDIVIKIFDDRISINERNLRELEDFEEDALNLLKEFASENKVISWNKMKEEIGKGTDFYKFIAAWNKKVRAHTGINKLFQSTGNTCMSGFAAILLTMAIVYYLVISDNFPEDEFSLATNLNTLVLLIGGFGLLMIIFTYLSEKTFGRWTPEGRLYYERWNSFKKYLTDLPALKEQTPDSINIWNSYLVYATSLGIAKEVLRNMSLIVPAEQLKQSQYHNTYYGYDQLNSGFGEAYTSSSPGGGDGGDVGGGSGGGGGGAE